MNFVYQHWSKHPYIRGGYTTQTANAYGVRQHLAEPVGGRLFFAGEATNYRVSVTVQSAIETGMRAAREVKQAIHFLKDA
jgi:monoamine oxidase